ncbi:MAG: hypothetical protein OHK0031_03490 [Anaerolineales bacterium]
MNFLQKLFGAGAAKKPKEYGIFHVKCKRCGEILEARVDLANDLSVEYEPGGDVFYCRKVLMGDGKNLCFQQIEIGLKYNANHSKLLEKRIEGGEFVEE